MAHFVRIRSTGMWTLASAITPAELEAFDANLFKAINGDDGGTWAPAARIFIGGMGVEITGAAICSNGLVVSGGNLDAETIEVGSGFFLTVNGTLETAGNVNFYDNTKTFTCHPSALFKSTTTVEGAFTAQVGSFFVGHAEFQSTSNMQGDVTMDGSLSVGTTDADTAAFAASVQFNEKVTLSGAAHIRKRVTNGGDADATYNVSVSDIVRVPASTLSANRAYTIGATGAGEGSCMRVYSGDSGFTVFVRRVDTSLMASLKNNSASAQDWVDLVYTGGRWEVIGTGDWT